MLLAAGADIDFYKPKRGSPPPDAVYFTMATVKETNILQLLLDHISEKANYTKKLAVYYDEVLRLGRNINIVKLYLQNLAIINFQTHSTVYLADEVAEKFYEICLHELNAMKNIYVYESISVFHILTRSRKKLSCLMGNKILVDNFEKIDCKEHFPTYEKMLTDKVNKAKEKRSIYVKSKLCLTTVLNFEFPEMVKEMILDNLTIFELKNLCNTCPESTV